MCGGTTNGRRQQLPIGGLSPRVRGNPDRDIAHWPPCGSIPACAGEPAEPGCASRSGWVYPRVCGGTLSQPSVKACGIGLSPRVRGNRWWRTLTRRPSRSIPACAGEPRNPAPRAACSRVYPRVCGGTPHLGQGGGMPKGLSPRVRGNRSRRAVGPGRGRSIPACAGEPGHYGAHLPRAEVYPRVCGGTAALPDHAAHRHGLSPRVRGNHRRIRHPQIHLRSIPACAGEPIAHSPSTADLPVYPRVCGGTQGAQSFPRRRRGLSPRVRGNRTVGGL